MTTHTLSGDQLVLNALERDLKRLSRLADKAQVECDEAMGISTEMIAISNETVEIVNSGSSNHQQKLKKLAALKARSVRAEKVRKKDLLKLINRQCETEINRDRLRDELERLKFRQGLRGM